MSLGGAGGERGSWTGGACQFAKPGIRRPQAAAVGIPRVKYLHEDLSILVSGQVRPKRRD